jgi:hypothetical protein
MQLKEKQYGKFTVPHSISNAESAYIRSCMFFFSLSTSSTGTVLYCTFVTKKEMLNTMPK